MAEDASHTVWEGAGCTDAGRVRTHNEDAWSFDPALGLACVCDGMGGHASGEVASQMAVETIAHVIASSPRQVDGPLLRTALAEASAAIYDVGEQDWGKRGMGTTAIAALLGSDRLVLAWAGDSRAYRYRDGRLERLTRDHSLLEEFIALRQPSAEEIELFPHKNVITRALGTDAEVDPESRTEQPQEGDLFLLCTDGLSNMLSDQAIASILATAPDLASACDALVAAANEAGGLDNITALLLRYRP